MAGVKLYADGALGSRGAAMLADYHDEPGQRGLLVTEPAALEAAMVKARDCGVQVATHAIGDRANRNVLDAYARVIGSSAAPKRWRIEHAQIVSPIDIPRFAKQGVIASMQPIHATSDGPGSSRGSAPRGWPAPMRGGVSWTAARSSPLARTSPSSPMIRGSASMQRSRVRTSTASRLAAGFPISG